VFLCANVNIIQRGAAPTSLAKLSLAMSAIFTVYGGLPILEYSNMMKHKSRLGSKLVLRKIGVLYYSYSSKLSSVRVIFTPYLLARRILFVFLLCFSRYDVYIQYSGVFVLSLIHVLILIRTSPYTNVLHSILHLINEILFMSVISLSQAFLPTQPANKRFLVGNVCIWIITIAFVINCIYVIVLGSFKFVQLLKEARKIKEKEETTKITVVSKAPEGGIMKKQAKGIRKRNKSLYVEHKTEETPIKQDESKLNLNDKSFTEIRLLS